MRAFDKIKLILRLPITVAEKIIYKKPNILSDSETIDYIVNNKCSISRFGDGELDLMCGIGIKFQKADKNLRKRLKQIAKNGSDKCLVCLPDVFYSKKALKLKMVEKSAEWWSKFLTFTRGIWYKSFKGKVFGDTNLSRFYMEVKDKSRTAEYVSSLKRIWDGANIVFVEGEKSRLGVGNDLFDNATTVKRIICPSANAFGCYDKILETVKELTSEDDLIICALGPTATVLCNDLSRNNRRALDLGHIDIEYEWFKMGAIEKVSVVGKDASETTNEFRGVNTIETDNILAVIS